MGCATWWRCDMYVYTAKNFYRADGTMSVFSPCKSGSVPSSAVFLPLPPGICSPRRIFFKEACSGKQGSCSARHNSLQTVVNWMRWSRQARNQESTFRVTQCSCTHNCRKSVLAKHSSYPLLWVPWRVQLCVCCLQSCCCWVVTVQDHRKPLI